MIGSHIDIETYSSIDMFQSLLFCGYDWKRRYLHLEKLRNWFQSLLFCGYDWKWNEHEIKVQEVGFNPCCSVDMIGRGYLRRLVMYDFWFQSLLFCGYDWKCSKHLNGVFDN